MSPIVQIYLGRALLLSLAVGLLFLVYRLVTTFAFNAGDVRPVATLGACRLHSADSAVSFLATYETLGMASM